jgi:hypothetical protein
MSPRDASAGKKAVENPAVHGDYETGAAAVPDAEADRNYVLEAYDTETGRKVRMAP